MACAERMVRPPIKETPFRGVFADSDKLFTRNLVPGRRVYGERLCSLDDLELREWVPRRSKLAAYLRHGGRFFPFREESRILYLGAASGTTASHLSDIAARGTVYCVEISTRSFRDLVALCEVRRNMIPVLADANRPDDYRFVVEGVDIVYQDVAQKNQASIFLKNMIEFGAKAGMVAIKARSEDVTMRPEDVFAAAEGFLRRSGMKVEDSLPLDPFEKDHAMIAVSMK